MLCEKIDLKTDGTKTYTGFGKNLSPAAFILNPFANIAAISGQTGGI